jgi:hypothetical protein
MKGFGQEKERGKTIVSPPVLVTNDHPISSLF